MTLQQIGTPIFNFTNVMHYLFREGGTSWAIPETTEKKEGPLRIYLETTLNPKQKLSWDIPVKLPFPRVIFEIDECCFFAEEIFNDAQTGESAIGLSRIGGASADLAFDYALYFKQGVFQKAAGQVTFIKPTTESVLIESVIKDTGDYAGLLKVLLDSLMECCGPILFGLIFLSCKNVNVIEKKRSRKLTKQEKKRGLWKHVFVQVHTLSLDPNKTTRYIYDGPAEVNEEQKRLHICRGHFMTYTKENPMFGQSGRVGTFWVPNYLKGNKEKGISIISEYEMGEKE